MTTRCLSCLTIVAALLTTYPGDNHNIANQFNAAMARSVAFMDKYVKGN